MALAEGRVGKVGDKEKIIASEAREIIKTPWADLTFSDRGWEISAGVDESNAEEGLILMPKNPFLSAEIIRNQIKEYFGLKKVGVIISDTKSVPLRVGTVGRAVGCAGFEPIKSYIGKEDLFGRKSRITVGNTADALAASAVLVMGEGNEQAPLAVIRQAPVVFVDRALTAKDREMQILPKDDIFSYIFAKYFSDKK